MAKKKKATPKVKKKGKAKLNKSVSQVKKHVINLVIKGSKVSDVVVTAFNKWYQNDYYFLVLSPFDNDPVLNDYILEASDFKTLLKDFQKKYSIYKYGFNVFIDGNLVFVMNKAVPNELDYKNEWLYKFIVLPEEMDLQGHYPIIVDDSNMEITHHVPMNRIGFVGHQPDSTSTDSVSVNKKTGEITSKGSTSIFQEIVLDDNVTLDADNRPEKKETTYSSVMITMPNTFLTFIPGDRIEITYQEQPEIVWKGTVKRWVSEQKSTLRTGFIIATGTTELNISGLVGDLFSRAGNMASSLSDMLSQASDALNTAKEYAKIPSKALSQMNTNIKNLRNQIKDAKDKVETTLEDTTNNVIGLVYDNIAPIITEGIDATLGRETFNEIVNIGEAVWNSPNLRLLGKSVLEVGSNLGLTIGEMMNSTGVIGTVNNDLIYKRQSNSILDNVIENNDIDDKYLNKQDGFDKYVNYLMLKDISTKSGYFYDFMKLNIKEEFFSDQSMEIIRSIILSDLDNDKIMRKYDGFPIFSDVMDYLRGYYKASMKELPEIKLEELDLNPTIEVTDREKDDIIKMMADWFKNFNEDPNSKEHKLKKLPELPKEQPKEDKPKINEVAGGDE